MRRRHRSTCLGLRRCVDRRAPPSQSPTPRPRSIRLHTRRYTGHSGCERRQRPCVTSDRCERDGRSRRGCRSSPTANRPRWRSGPPPSERAERGTNDPTRGDAHRVEQTRPARPRTRHYPHELPIYRSRGDVIRKPGACHHHAQYRVDPHKRPRRRDPDLPRPEGHGLRTRHRDQPSRRSSPHRAEPSPTADRRNEAHGDSTSRAHTTPTHLSPAAVHTGVTSHGTTPLRSGVVVLS